MMSVLLYEKDLEVLLDATRFVPTVGSLSRVPFIGKFFDFSETLSFRARLQQAQAHRMPLEVTEEDVKTIAFICDAGLKGDKSSPVNIALGYNTEAARVLQKILMKLRFAYPEYFEEANENN